MSEENQVDNIQQSKTDSRRVFMRRAGTGAIIAALPMKSVWANGIAHSIVASGHGSDWAGGTQIVIGSHGYWKNHFPASFENVQFKAEFGRHPVRDDGSNLNLRKHGGGRYHPTLKDLVNSQGNSGIELPGVKKNLNGSANPAWLKATNKKDSDGKTIHVFDLSGPDNVNPHIVAMFLTAMLQHVTPSLHYPVAESFGSVDAYITYLTNEYSKDPGGLGKSLDAIIDECGTGAGAMCDVSTLV